MRKILCLIVVSLLISSCGTKKLSKTSIMGAMGQNDFCEHFPCQERGLAKEAINDLALECWEQELQNLPDMIMHITNYFFINRLAIKPAAVAATPILIATAFLLTL